MRDKFMTKYSAEFKEAAVRKMTATLLGSGLMEQDTFMTDDTVNHQGISCDPKRNYKHYLKEFKEETGVSITEQGSTVTKATKSRGQR